MIKSEIYEQMLKGVKRQEVYIPDMLWMPIDDDVVCVRSVIDHSASTRLLKSHMLWTDRVLQSLRWHRRIHCGLGRLNHLVVSTFISCNVNRKRVVSQRLHLVDCQVSVGLIRQSCVFAYRKEIAESLLEN